MDDNHRIRFQKTIFDVLTQLGRESAADYRRFIATLYDLGNEFTEECRFISHNTDAAVLKMCEEVISCKEQDIRSHKEKVSEYILREYMSDRKWTDYIAASLITAYAAYGNKVPIGIVLFKEDDFISGAEIGGKGSGDRKHSNDNDSFTIKRNGLGYVISENNGDAADTDANTNTPSPQEKIDENIPPRRKGNKAIIIAVIALFVVIAIALFVLVKICFHSAEPLGEAQYEFDDAGVQYGYVDDFNIDGLAENMLE